MYEQMSASCVEKKTLLAMNSKVVKTEKEKFNYTIQLLSLNYIKLFSPI